MIRDMTLQAIKQAYRTGELTPLDLFEDIRARSARYTDSNIWIHLLGPKEQDFWLSQLTEKCLETHPLWGIPFAVKDNIDVAQVATTAGCSEFSYLPNRSAHVVQRLIDAGAIPVGKTNLDQFATGLNGTRSPYGPVRNAFDPELISGGSSSGSATALALGLCSFSLGTDTAGSGRIPACFNNLVGLKPTNGILSSTGMVPACRSLDCMSIFTFTCDDAASVFTVAEGFDKADFQSRPNSYSNSEKAYGQHTGTLKVAVIQQKQLNFFGSEAYFVAYQRVLDKLEDDPDFELCEIDFEPFREAARLLYEGPWVAERYIACRALIERNPGAMHPVVRKIIERGKDFSATQLFEAQYKLKALRARAVGCLNGCDCFLTPTAGRHYRIDELYSEPEKHNSELGYYSNFINLFDMAAVAVPVYMTPAGTPFGLTLSSKSFTDRALLSIANRLEQLFPTPLGALGLRKPVTFASNVQNSKYIDLVVCGAHLDGLSLNWQLTQRGARLIKKTKSASRYRLFLLSGGSTRRPGMIRDENNGFSIDVEVWRIEATELGSFVSEIAPPLAIGKVELDDGIWYTGFICEASGVANAEEISQFGGWRGWLNSLE